MNPCGLNKKEEQESIETVQYVIHSKSERGFWNNRQGWVYGAAQATKFTGTETNFKPYLIGVTDCEWLPYKYDE